MTSFVPIDLTCPCCGKDFQGTKLLSTNTFRGVTTDLHPLAVGFEPLSFTISTCPDCGFTHYSGGWPVRDEWPVSGSLKPETCERVRSEIKPLVGEGRLDGSLRFRFLALIGEWEGREAIFMADTYLKAAWLASEESGHTDIEMSCRRLAIEYFEKALAELDRSDQRYLSWVYLIGELYRRIGERERANQWFDKAISTATPQDQAWVAELARQQRTDPKEYK
jgi:uncharacterized protein (DUF2225 family)